MPYLANVLNVMIASPSDVHEERLAVRDAVSEWNTIHARDRKVILMSIGWETHAVPEMGDRPQAIINRQLLRDADLLVAVFWTRLGSPTGVAQSGTVEEIEEHLGAGKPAMIYFSSAPVHPDSIDENQYAALKGFKASLKSRGLYEAYETTAQFRDKFRKQLAQKIISSFQSGRDNLALETIDYSAPVPLISTDATQLLLEASNDPRGVVMSISTLDQGAAVQTNNRSFAEIGNPRSEAQWRGAVDELVRKELLVDRGGENEVFFVTGEGYRVADLFKHISSPAPL